MKKLVHGVVNAVKRGRRFKSAAHFALNCVPDITVTRHADLLGPMRYRLRRHHFFWTEPYLPTHAIEFGIFNAFVKPGDVVYDIGGNIGLYARFLIGPFRAGKVFCFEPMHDNFELLKANLALAKDPTVGRAFELALSDTDGETELQVDDVTSGSAVLNDVSHGKPSAGRLQKNLPPKTERVTVRRLDALVAEEKLPPPNFVKIDTEGAGGYVLRGARETIDQHGPRMMVGLHGDEEARPVLEILNGLGYACFGDDGKGRGYRELTVADLPADKCDMVCSRTRSEVEREPPAMTSVPATWR